MAQARELHAAVLLPDGRVMVVGGRQFDFGADSSVVDESLSSVEFFDPASGTWTAGPSLHRWRERLSAVVLDDGRVLVVGGREGVGDTAMDTDPTAETFDPATNAWTVIRNVPFHVTDAIALESGNVLTIGHFLNHSASQARSSVYHPKTGEFGPVRTISGVSIDPAATRLHDGRVLVAGGLRGYGEGEPEPRAEAAIYDPASAFWTQIESMPNPQLDHAIATLTDGRAIVQGGGAAELFDPTTGHWSLGAEPASFRGNTSLVVTGGRVLAIGASSGYLYSAPIIEAFDTADGTWATVTAFPVIDSMTTTVLTDGRVLIAGGTLECRFGQACDNVRVLPNAWLLDPADLP